MNAHFYILAKSFHHNAKFSNAEIEEKIKRLAEDVRLIHQYKDTNTLYVNWEEIYPQVFYDKYTIEDFICKGYQLKGYIDRDILNALQNILNRGIETTDSFQKITDELLPFCDGNKCHGLIAFHKVDGIDDTVQLIYGIDGWYKFRRHFLGLYPKDENFFIDECIKYFPNLFFHNKNRISIKAIFKDCPKKIIYHLVALNDIFYNLKKTQESELNRTQVLVQFSISASLDETASLEGDPKRKRDFTFDFTNTEGQIERVCCEPHLKLCKNDVDSSYSTNRRIYFHEGMKNIHEGRILIGHIGTHL